MLRSVRRQVAARCSQIPASFASDCRRLCDGAYSKVPAECKDKRAAYDVCARDQVTYACNESGTITNPVWVTRGSGDFQPPGVVPFDVLDQPSNDPKMQAFAYLKSTVRAPKTRKLSAQSTARDRFEPRGKVPLFYPRAENVLDVRKVLSRFGHLGGHVE